MDDNVLAGARSATTRAAGHGGAAIPWNTPSNSGKTGNGVPAWGRSPSDSRESATAEAEPARFSTRSCPDPPQQGFHLRAPDSAPFTVPGPNARQGLLEAEHQIAWPERRRKFAESFPTLALDGIAQACCTRQTFGYDQTDPHRAGRGGWTIMKVETRAPHHPPRRHDGRKLLRPVQTLVRAKRSPPLRPRDDGDPWHDAHGSQHDHRGYACARGSRGCVCGAQPKAGRCVSWQYPLNEQKRRITTFYGCFVKRSGRDGCG